jgi:non-heme chloroperoxidase
MNRSWVLAAVLLLSLAAGLAGQSPATWHDPSPHTVQLVTVDQDVKLEVLDWGGSGRALVLLPGGGDTAHVYDDFAAKLTSQYHVYGITRRGYGASSAPAPDKNNYSSDRLGDDVLAVLDVLKIERPVLVGHSAGGEELSSVGSRHPERIAGLIYLDAAYQYAYYDRSQGFLLIDLKELKNDLADVTPDDIFAKRELVQKLQNDLPELELDLKAIQKGYTVPLSLPPPMPSAADKANLAAFRSWQTHTQGFAPPEAEIREHYEINADGSVGQRRDPPPAFQAMLEQMQKYTDLRVPILAIYADPQDWGTYKSAAERDAAVEGVAKAFQAAVPTARVVLLPKTNHYIYMANEADVLREMRSFLETLHE